MGEQWLPTWLRDALRSKVGRQPAHRGAGCAGTGVVGAGICVAVALHADLACSVGGQRSASSTKWANRQPGGPSLPGRAGCCACQAAEQASPAPRAWEPTALAASAPGARAPSTMHAHVAAGSRQPAAPRRAQMTRLPAAQGAMAQLCRQREQPPGRQVQPRSRRHRSPRDASQVLQHASRDGW